VSSQAKKQRKQLNEVTLKDTDFRIFEKDGVLISDIQKGNLLEILN